jgi:hypothetical protein
MKDFTKETNKTKHMAIQLQPQPVTANAALTAEDVQNIVSALSSVVTLPSGESYSNVLALNITIQPSGAGVLNVRFSK